MLHPINGVIRHENLNTDLSVDAEINIQAEELVNYFLVASWVEVNGPYDARIQGVVMIFTGLNIGTKWDYTVIVMAELHTYNNLTGT